MRCFMSGKYLGCSAIPRKARESLPGKPIPAPTRKKFEQRSSGKYRHHSRLPEHADSTDYSEIDPAGGSAAARIMIAQRVLQPFITSTALRSAARPILPRGPVAEGLRPINVKRNATVFPAGSRRMLIGKCKARSTLPTREFAIYITTLPTRAARRFRRTRYRFATRRCFGCNESGQRIRRSWSDCSRQCETEGPAENRISFRRSGDMAGVLKGNNDMVRARAD